MDVTPVPNRALGRGDGGVQHPLLEQKMTSLEFTEPVRCYNGAYDSASQRVLDAQDAALARIRKREPDAHVTYFPVEGTYIVHVYGRPLSAERSTRGAALANALELL